MTFITVLTVKAFIVVLMKLEARLQRRVVQKCPNTGVRPPSVSVQPDGPLSNNELGPMTRIPLFLQ